jgi:circadian clock protein KaiC
LTDRLSSGNANLDAILKGGLPKNAINLIVGIPGSGKTILSQQFAFHNATREQPALYLSTLSEPLDKILRYAESLSFFDPIAIRDGRIVYEDMGDILGGHGLADVIAAIDRYLKEVRPGVVVIDSFRAFHALAKDETTFRQFLYELTRRLTAHATTSLWNAPYTRDQAVQAAEFAVADAIIALDMKQIAERELRVLQVLKLRGGDFLTGEHAYKITAAGLTVFPRLADIHDNSRYELRQGRAESGIAALDDLLGHRGYWEGATTLVTGPSGIGKTLMGLHFLYHGAHNGEPGILATFQENVSQLGRIVSSFGWSIDDPNVHIFSQSPVNLNIDEWVYELLDMIETTGSRRVVIDSLADLRSAAGDAVRFREWMFSLIQRCARVGISVMLISEVPDLFQLQRISEEAISHLADNVVLLQYVQEGPELSRALTVLKTRAMPHRPLIHKYEITERGFELGPVIALKSAR